MQRITATAYSLALAALLALSAGCDRREGVTPTTQAAAGAGADAVGGAAARPRRIPWEGEPLEETKRRGDRLVELLERFNQQNGRYPSSLAEVADPAELQALQPTAGTGVWVYESGGKSFGLHVMNNHNKDSYWKLYVSAPRPNGKRHWFEDR